MLSIIIVNYKTPDITIHCIKSIINKTKNIAYEIIVVDNCSNDDSKSLITNICPTIRWIDMKYNAGFARANNTAIKQAKGNIVLLLNSDTVNTANSIENCYNSFENSEYLACGIQLLNEDSSLQISGNYVVTGGLNYLLPLPVIGGIIKFLGNKLKVKKPSIKNTHDIVEVDWINGAFLMFKKEIIEKIGMMDEEFFLYAEEAEWCSRIKKIGELVIYGQFNIIHLQGTTANKIYNSMSIGYQKLNDKKGLQIMLSNLVRIRKEFGLIWFLFHLCMYSIFSCKNTWKIRRFITKIIFKRKTFYKI